MKRTSKLVGAGNARVVRSPASELAAAFHMQFETLIRTPRRLHRFHDDATRLRAQFGVDCRLPVWDFADRRVRELRSP